jgi:dTDP-4-amino-4,6-dideoxygalactose transaminase
MADAGIKKTIRRKAMGIHGMGVPRLVALLGGTTTLADCLVALRYLAAPRQLVRGPVIREYEQAFAQQIGVRYAYSFSSGRVGLYGLLHGLGVGPGDEVLLQVPTHIVVPNAIRYVGARPVYVDCRRDTYNMDLEQAERRITPRTKVLLLQHTFGIPSDLDAALDLARRYGLEVIEDCVHALGATYDGRQVGSFGRAAFFSTEETKTISSTMGGMVVTDDPDLAARMQTFQASCAWPSASLTTRYVLKLVLYHLLTEPYVHPYVRRLYELLGRRNPLPRPTTREEVQGGRPTSYEQRLSNAQAALALGQLRRLESNIAHRREVTNRYRKRLSEKGIDVPQPPAKAEPAFVRYPVWVQDREAAMRMVAPYALLGTWFTSVLEEAVSPAHGDYEMGSCPQAEAAAKYLVNLPTHPRISAQDVEKIASAIVKTALVTKKDE